MKQFQVKTAWLVVLLLLVGIACQLTSPTPASWSGTPTAQARAATNTAIALTQQANFREVITLTPIELPVEEQRTPTLQPTAEVDGPWLVFPALEAGVLYAYDVESKTTLEIFLPEPIFENDLIHGLSPDGVTLVVRAGSPLETDELALYKIDLPSTEVTKLSPLLSLSLQRKIVNEEGTRAFETLQTITRPDGLAWSPDGRFLAFTAALDNESSDLYVVDTLNERIERLNGLFSQNATPFWSPGSNWLISQELGSFTEETGWRAEFVSGLRVPGYIDQNTLYIPLRGSQGEVFVDWINAQNFISYSQTAEGAHTLRRINVETKVATMIFQGLFNQAAFDPVSRSLAFTLSYDAGAPSGLVGGIYFLGPESSTYRLLRAGDWKRLSWEPGGMFVAVGSQGVFAFTPDGEGLLLAGESDARLSPHGNWLIAWGDGENSVAGARLYQPSGTQSLQTLIEAKVETTFWQPDSEAFFIQSEGVVYHLAFPGLNLTEVAAGFSEDVPLDLIWVK